MADENCKDCQEQHKKRGRPKGYKRTPESVAKQVQTMKNRREKLTEEHKQ